MALVFPDQAPSRFGAALRSGTSTKLSERNPPTSSNLMGLVRAISHHDRATRGHSERVRAYAQLIGQEMQLDPKNLDRLSWAALLHDVGKLDVAPEILNKKGRPNDIEWDELRQHPAKAPSYLVGFDHWMGDWGRAASEHHERWDGNGYPSQLQGKDIHPAGRIVAVADAYDVMVSVRSYQKSMSPALAREEIARNAGSQFDPEVVRAFLNVGIGQVSTKWGALAWLTQIPDVVSRAPAAALAAAVGLGAMVGLIDPGAAAEPVDEVAVIADVEPTPTPTATVAIAAQPLAPPTTATPTATATVTPAAAPVAASQGGGGNSGADGSGDSDSSDADDDGSSDEAASEDDAPDDGSSDSAHASPGDGAPTPVPGTLTPAVTATPTPAATVTPTTVPTPTVNPVFALLGGAPTPTPHIDNPVFALLGGAPTPTPTPNLLDLLYKQPTPGPGAGVIPPLPPSPTPTLVPDPVATPTEVPATATPVIPPTPTPTPIPMVTFFEGLDFTGASLGPFVAGSYPFNTAIGPGPAPPGWNDRISSARIPAGVQLLACPNDLNDTARCTTFVGDQSDFGSLDNQISSFEITVP